MMRYLISTIPFFFLEKKSIRLFGVLMVIAFGQMGCITMPEPPDEPIVVPETVPIEQYESLKAEIEHLKTMVAEKDQLIKNQQIRQKNQAQVIREANQEASRAQVKLHRLATKPSTASAIAEVETALEQLNSTKISSSDQVLQVQAQRLLESASSFFKKDQFVVAMNHASQASYLISQIQDKNRKNDPSINLSVIDFRTPIALRTKANVNLRKEPRNNAQVLIVIPKDSVVSANANYGSWVRIQSDDKQGWILSNLLDIEKNENP